ncbi:MAG TPA: NAD(P)/FAD-dependent oxidoreductase [Vicinamibacteria bacterium]|nr:NAD(P)/FAD-dependent oxidoreductase [Vicinamibacteria bacterium]
MRRTDTIIIGGGQAGLAMSRCLTDRSIDHVILERGRVAQRWRSERWDSLRLLTPSWQSRLPGFRYEGADPNGFMTMPEIIDYLERYAESFSAPVVEETTVRSVRRVLTWYRVTTDWSIWEAPNVVIATGHADKPYVPDLAKGLSDDLLQLVPSRYRNPAQLPAGGALVVGASASGIQLANEIHASGHPVTLSVGRHTRLPRCYRGRDIMWWLDAMGALDERVEGSRNKPSLQLIGAPDGSSIDLGILQHRGIRLAGRAIAVDRDLVSFADDLKATTTRADAKLADLLERIDRFIELEGLQSDVDAAEPLVPVRPYPAPTEIDLRASGITTVLWATGFRRSYPWLKVPVLDERGEIRHEGGVTDSPGLYVLGLQFLKRRKSSFIDGVGADASELAEHIDARLARRTAA